MPPQDYRTRLGFRPWLARVPAAPDHRIEAAVRRTQEKDKKYQAAQLHSAPISFLFQRPAIGEGNGISVMKIGAIYTAETTQFVPLIRLKVSVFNLYAWSLTGFVSKVSDLGAIAAGLGGDVIVQKDSAIVGAREVSAQEVYSADIDAPMQHYLSAGEQLFFGVIAWYDSPVGQLIGPVIFGEATIKYVVTGRGFV